MQVVSEIRILVFTVKRKLEVFTINLYLLGGGKP